jgi:hypothetical protein
MQNVIFMQTFVDDRLHVRWTRRNETIDWPPDSTAELSLMSRYQLFPSPISQNTDEVKDTIRGAY